MIRFAGDSGDGMQLTGDRFTSETAVFGNDLATLPDFPAEIRAPAGSLPGVSGFQVHLAAYDILTPGDHVVTFMLRGYDGHFGSASIRVRRVAETVASGGKQ